MTRHHARHVEGGSASRTLNLIEVPIASCPSILGVARVRSRYGLLLARLWLVTGLALGGAISSGCEERRGPERDDAVAQQITETLGESEGLTRPQVEVTVKQGVAYLDGEVDEVSQKAEAERAAKRVTGVVEVVNQLQVQP